MFQFSTYIGENKESRPEMDAALYVFKDRLLKVFFVSRGTHCAFGFTVSKVKNYQYFLRTNKWI
jgi:hypothetical protein